MSATTSTTTLGYALLADIRQQARSGYDLRKQFASTPLRYFSDSPGAIYPALRRLRVRGWIASVPSAGRSARRREAFAITPEGVKALERWLRQPVTSAAVATAMEDLLLRFAYSEEILGRRVALRLVVELERELDAHIAYLDKFHAAAAGKMTLTGRLALENGIEIYRAHRRWCQAAGRRLRGASRKGKS